MKKKTLKQTLSMIVVLTLLLGILPVNAWAADHVHDAACGYSEPSECTHAHDGACGYVAEVLGVACGHSHDDACGYSEGSAGTPCGHVHGNCGYAEAIPGTPCTHDCASGGCTPNEDGVTYTCAHTHGDCGYSEGTPASACSHTQHTDCGYVPEVPGTACNHSHDNICGYVEAVSGNPCTHTHDDVCGYSEGSECTYVEPLVEETGHEHNFAGGWSANEDSHWHICVESVNGIQCNEKSDLAAHNWDSQYTITCLTCHYSKPHTHTGGTATCKYQATCELCGFYYGEKDPNNHQHPNGYGDPIDEKTHRIICLGCDHVFVESEAHNFGNWSEDGDNQESRYCSDCLYTEYRTIETHTHDWGDWTANGDGTHTRTCTIDANHTETANCAVYTYVQVDEHNHNILCECFSGENYYVLGTEAHTMSEWVRDGEFDRRECTKHCDYYEEREHTHDWSNYTYKGNGVHTRNCTAEGCTSQQVEACGGMATCHELAFCPDCETTYGEIDQKNHSGGTEVRNAKKATETENGYTGDTYCLGCETLLNEGSIIYATGSGDDDDDTHTHNYSYYNYDGTNHWKMCHCGQGQAGSVKPHSLIITGASTGHFEECTVCEYYSDVEDHVYTDDSDAFCNECGYRRHVHEYSFAATCTSPAMCSCRATTGDKDPTNHTGGTEIRNAKEATETEKGYTGDTYCRGCGAKLASGKYTERLGFVEVKYDDDVVVKEVTFQPIAGSTIPEDAEVIVKDHTATIEPIAGLVGENANTEYVSLDDEDIEITEPLTFTYNGVTYRIDEVVKIEDTEYIVSSITTSVSLMRLTDGVVFEFNRYSGVMQKFSTGTYKKMSSKLSINGVTYDVVTAFNPYEISEDKLDTDRLTYWVLYHEGKPVGRYFPNQGWATFDENYDPATLKAQQDNIFIGSVTVPEKDKGLKTRAELVADLEAAQQAYDEYVHEHHYLSPALEMAKIKAEQALAEYDAIAQLAAKKRYNVYEIGANEISIKNATAVSGTITQTFEVPAEFVGNENVKYVAVHDPNPYAKALAEAEATRFTSSHNEMEYIKLKALYDSWAEANEGVEYGTVTVSADGKTLIATYEVDSFSTFIVYAFVEADELEIKTLSATIEIPDESAPQAPTPAVEDAPGSSIFLWITIMSLAAIALLAVVIVAAKRKRR